MGVKGRNRQGDSAPPPLPRRATRASSLGLIPGTSFRPRAIDIEKKIPVLHEELEDDEFTIRTMPQLETGMEDEEAQEKHIQEAIKALELASLHSELKMKLPDIPTPHVVVLENDRGRSKFSRPSNYIREVDRTFDEEEYDMEGTDFEWLDDFNKNRKKPISQDTFEIIVRKIEYAQARYKQPESEEQPTPSNSKAKKKPKKPVKLTEEQIRASLMPLEFCFEQLRQERIPGNPDLDAIGKVYSHWVERRVKKGRPLLPSLVPDADPNDQNPFIAFRPRPETLKKFKNIARNDKAALKKLKSLRSDLDQARVLLEHVEKRERVKKAQIGNMGLIFEKNVVAMPHIVKVAKKQHAKKKATAADRKRKQISPRPKKIMEVEEREVSSEDVASTDDEFPPFSPLGHSFFDVSEADPTIVGSIQSLQKSIMEFESAKEFRVISHLSRYYGHEATKKIRARPRIGRGGRLVYDRVLWKNENIATVKSVNKRRKCNFDFSQLDKLIADREQALIKLQSAFPMSNPTTNASQEVHTAQQGVNSSSGASEQLKTVEQLQARLRAQGTLQVGASRASNTVVGTSVPHTGLPRATTLQSALSGNDDQLPQLRTNASSTRIYHSSMSPLSNAAGQANNLTRAQPTHTQSVSIHPPGGALQNSEQSTSSHISPASLSRPQNARSEPASQTCSSLKSSIPASSNLVPASHSAYNGINSRTLISANVTNANSLA